MGLAYGSHRAGLSTRLVYLQCTGVRAATAKWPGPRFIKLKRYELVLIAHWHMRIVKIQRVGQSARILPIQVKEGNIRGKSTSFL